MTLAKVIRWISLWKLVRKLKLSPMALSAIGFEGMTMQTADHREITLYQYIKFDVGVDGIWRTIRAFVGPETKDLTGKQIEHHRLLLGLPWLYAVGAVISIRESSIQIGNPAIGEKSRHVTGPELCFHQDHNLLMYTRGIMPTYKPPAVNDDTSSDDGFSDSSEDDLSELEEVERNKDF